MTPSDPNSQAVHREYDWERTPASKAIVESVNAIETSTAGANRGESRDPLYAYIDMDALNTITTSATEFLLTFRYANYTIQIDNASIYVSPH